MGTVIVTASGKGGTGKTSFSAGTAVALCARGEKVLLIDADTGLRSLDLVLGMSDRLLFSYADVIEGRASLKEASVKHGEVKNLRVLTAPGSVEACRGISREGIAELVARARKHFTYTIIDCSAGISGDIVAFAEAADRAVIVSTADQTSLRGAQKTAQAFEAAGQSNCRIVVNRVRAGLIDEGRSVNIDKAMDTSGLPLLGIVPEDEDVIACANAGKILMLCSRGSAAQAYSNIAARISGERVPALYKIKL